MLDQLPPAGWLAGFAVVGTLVFLRARYGPITSVRWQPIRRLVVPVLNWAAKRYLGSDWYATSQRDRDEHVASVDLAPDELLDDLEAAGYEPQPLASLSVDWAGRMEVASWCRYYGPKPFPAAPYWLRERQVHVRLFETDEGTALAAHAETNPWRADRWQDHYRSESIDVQEGRRLVAADLGIEPRSLSERHDP